jgi:Uma2 family endonuclease
MRSMTVGAADPYTVDDLVGMPDDGRRYELLDGELLVSPAPGWLHQRAVVELCVALRLACPPELEVLVAPFAVRQGDDTELQPDVLVARRSDFGRRGLAVAPVLAVEVLSPSTAMVDRHLKRAAYERMGCPSYWIVDPELPDLTVFELDEQGCYAQRASVAGGVEFAAVRPFPVTVAAAALVARGAEG